MKEDVYDYNTAADENYNIRSLLMRKTHNAEHCWLPATRLMTKKLMKKRTTNHNTTIMIMMIDDYGDYDDDESSLHVLPFWFTMNAYTSWMPIKWNRLEVVVSSSFPFFDFFCSQKLYKLTNLTTLLQLLNIQCDTQKISSSSPLLLQGGIRETNSHRE